MIFFSALSLFKKMLLRHKDIWTHRRHTWSKQGSSGSGFDWLEANFSTFDASSFLRNSLVLYNVFYPTLSKKVKYLTLP
jgi:hypothetical protein